MTKKNLAIVLISVIIAGAVAGAFVYLSQTDDISPAALPSAAGSVGQTGVAQSLQRILYGTINVRPPGRFI